jgi:histidinol-phosphate aminotransferase
MSERKPYRLRDAVAQMPATVPFVGPEAQERQRGKPFSARIGANECLFGVSPKAVAAMAEAGKEIWKYGDPEGHDLRHALAKFHGVKPGNVVLGPGIDGLLGYVSRMFVEPGVHVVTSNGAYPTFNFHVTGYGGSLHKVAYRDDREDLVGLAAKARETGARMVYVSNPDNPMGTWWQAGDIARFLDELPEACLLLLDEAYCDYAPPGTAPAIDVTDARLVRFRTFSKAYGMAGARVGYCIGQAELIAEFEKIRDHYGMNRTAEIGAMAALADRAWLGEVIRQTDAAKTRIGEIARDHNLGVIPSATNFVTIDCSRDTAFARSVMEGILQRGVFIRMPGAEPLSRCIRVTAGYPQDLDHFAEALGETLRTLG